MSNNNNRTAKFRRMRKTQDGMNNESVGRDKDAGIVHRPGSFGQTLREPSTINNDINDCC